MDLTSTKSFLMTPGVYFVKPVKYIILISIYLISVVASSIANSIGGNVQNFYRVPGVDIRWMDLVILLITASFFYHITSKSLKLKHTGGIVGLCVLYLLFESVQLYRSWGMYDATSQLSHFLCTLSLFIMIELSTNAIPIPNIVKFLRLFAILGAVVLSISNYYLIYSFITGNVVFEDLDIRVALEVEGSKETVYSTVLMPLVYSIGLYVLPRRGNVWEKAVYIMAILSIYASLALTFHRGTLVTVVVISFYFIIRSGKFHQLIVKVAGVILMMATCYLMLGSMLSKKGYDPIDKIVETAKFSVDVKNPDWDKGRSISQDYALKAWHKNIWFGAGYDELLNYGLPETIATAHNGFITSAFHRGIVGTIILMLVLGSGFMYSYKLWFLLKYRQGYEDDIIRLLIMTAAFWIIPFMTQEALWEKYSLCIQYMYFGLIINIYKQLVVQGFQLRARELKTA